MNPNSKSCLRCTRFITCTDKRRLQRNHSCDSFIRLREIDDVSQIGAVQMVPDGEDDLTVPTPAKTAHPSQKRGRETADPAFVVSDSQNVPENFVYEAMQRAYDPVTNMVRDLRVDDSRLPLAKNYYDYCANLSGSRIKMPFARQLWMCLVLLGEMCPVCTHRKAFDIFNVPVDVDPHKFARSVTLMHNGVCPKCGATRHELLASGKQNDYYEFDLVAGQRSGKTTVAATLSTYVFHRHLKSPKLSSMVSGIQDFTPLTASFVALTVTKAIKLLWTPVRDMIAASEWFNDYFDTLDRIGRQNGKELYQFKPSGVYLRVFHRNLEMLPEGPSKRTLRGATRWLAVTDELGWFPYDVRAQAGDDDTDQSEERERANADEVYTSLDNSLGTVRVEVPTLYQRGIYTVPQGLNVNLSSPSSWRDKIMRLWKESQGSRTALGVKAATWEISPRYSRDSSYIVDKFNKDPRKAMRDFGAEPPALSSAVFTKEALLPLFNQRIWYRPAYEDHPARTTAVLVKEFSPATLPPSVLSLDAGQVDNSFALTLAFKVGNTFTAPLVLEVIPDKDKPVNFPIMYAQVIKTIIRDCNVAVVVADRWNSIYLLDQIQIDFPKVKALALRLVSRDVAAFKAVVASGQLLLPSLEIPVEQIETAVDYKTAFKRYAAAHLLSQFLTVQEVDGMLYKGENATDDILRSLMVAIKALQDPKLLAHVRDTRTVEREAAPASSLILVGSRIGGSPFM